MQEKKLTMHPRPTNLIRRIFLVLLVSSTFAARVFANSEPHHIVWTRAAFNAAANRVVPGMSPAQVSAILGAPDYEGRFYSGVEGWFYGCSGPLRLPLLGTVEFDEKGLVILVAKVSHVPDKRISEAELQRTLLLLDRAPGFGSTNPGAMIRAVNRLLPLGKAKILLAVHAYCDLRLDSSYLPEQSLNWKRNLTEVPSSRDALYVSSRCFGDTDIGLRYLLRVLFDIPPKLGSPCGQTMPLPILLIGAFAPRPPLDSTRIPRFPVVLCDDVPLFETFGAALGGLQEPLIDELPLYEQHGRLRTCPLHPTDHPERLLSDLQKSPQWLFRNRYKAVNDGTPSTIVEIDSLNRDNMRRRLKEQIIKLLAPLYPSSVHYVDAARTSMPAGLVEADISQWDAIMADLKVHPVRWNPATEEYEKTHRR